MEAIKMYRTFLANMIKGIDGAIREERLKEEYEKITLIKVGLLNAFYMDHDIINRKEHMSIYALIKVDIVRALLSTVEVAMAVKLQQLYLDDLLHDINAMRYNR